MLISLRFCFLSSVKAFVLQFQEILNIPAYPSSAQLLMPALVFPVQMVVGVDVGGALRSCKLPHSRGLLHMPRRRVLQGVDSRAPLAPLICRNRCPGSGIKFWPFSMMKDQHVSLDLLTMVHSVSVLVQESV